MSDVQGGAPAPSAESNSSAEQSQVDSSVTGDLGQSGSESGQEAQVDAIAQAVEDGAITEKQAQSMIRKLQLKVNGKVVEKEVDLSDENFLKQQFQLAEMSKISMQQKAEQEKLFKQIIEKGKGDPLAFIKELYGIDPDELAVMHLEKKVEHMKKSPEVLAQEKLQAELQAAREEAKRLKEEKENAELSKMQTEALEGLKQEISTAISAHTKLPNSEKFQRRVADAMQWAVNQGFEDVKADDVVGIVEKEWQEEIQSFMDGAEEEIIESYVGKKNLARLKAKNVAAIKAKQMPAAAAALSQIKPTASDSSGQSKQAEKINAKDFWRRR